jgi:hypothetical protein
LAIGPGVVVGVQMLHGQVAGAVVNVHATSVASWLPATSLTPLAPPFTVAGGEFKSGADGVSVATPLL